MNSGPGMVMVMATEYWHGSWQLLLSGRVGSIHLQRVQKMNFHDRLLLCSRVWSGPYLTMIEGFIESNQHFAC